MLSHARDASKNRYGGTEMKASHLEPSIPEIIPGYPFNDRFNRDQHSPSFKKAAGSELSQDYRYRIAPAEAPAAEGIPVVFVLDEDVHVRNELFQSLSPLGYCVKTFRLASEFLAYGRPKSPACLLMELRLPDGEGLELQRHLAAVHGPPVVFMTGNGDVRSSVRAIKAGAIQFLSKPFSHEELLEAVREAIVKDRSSRQRHARLSELRRRYATLTPREREVLPLVVSGYLNKEAAWELGICEDTLHIHRRNVMRKMESRSLAELVRMASQLGLFPNEW